ncbi:spermine/spermidine synthase [Marinicella litoralis]|uniref:Spermine/spermidine synthase n=2 Tax=Marinicella litoralis TaxID=644220 RepID=A0A4R6XDS0_9GAMM|nr:spermine/spermidine synthase [Marinicella litoralis]
MVLLAVLLTGLCSLVYQTIWQRYLSFSVGSDASASVLILTTFLTALSVGYWSAGALSRRAKHKELLCYGWVEIIIGLWAMMFPLLFKLASSLLSFQLLPVFWMDLLITVLLIGPPAVLMGVTLPFLTQGLSQGFQSASLTHARIYAINTIGAFLGTLLAGFFLIEHLGLALSSYLLGALNVSVGVLVLIFSPQLSRHFRNSRETIENEVQTESTVGFNPQSAVDKRYVLLVAACSGFLLIALETYFIRLFSMVTEGSHLAYPTVVGAFIAAVGIGAYLAGKWLPSAARLFVVVPIVMLLAWIVIYYTLPEWPYTDMRLKQFVLTATDAPIYLFVARFVLFFVVIAIPVVTASMLLPWAFHFFKNTDTALGKTTGDLYAVATLATVVGGLVGGYWMFQYFNFEQIFLSFLCVLLLMVFAANQAIIKTRKQYIWVKSALPLLLVGVYLFPVKELEQRLALGFYFQSTEKQLTDLNSAAAAHEWLWQWFGHDQIIASDMQPEGRVDVFQSEQSGQRMIAINGRSNSDTAMSDLAGNGLLGLFPYLLTESPKKVLIVGLGTGVTAGILAHQELVEVVDVSEINAAVIKQFHWFDPFTYQGSQNPKINMIHSDVIKHLHQSEEVYDMIISIPSNFWVAGVENLLTPEFYQLIDNNLNSGGMFVQWVPEYRFSAQGLLMIAKTFSSSFSTSSLWQLTDNDLVFLYKKNGSVNADQSWLESRSGNQLFRATLREIGVYNVRKLLNSQLATHENLLQVSSNSETHSLDKPQLGQVALMALYKNDVNYNSSEIIKGMRAQKKASR